MGLEVLSKGHFFNLPYMFNSQTAGYFPANISQNHELTEMSASTHTSENMYD